MAWVLISMLLLTGCGTSAQEAAPVSSVPAKAAQESVQESVQESTQESAQKTVQESTVTEKVSVAAAASGTVSKASAASAKQDIRVLLQPSNSWDSNGQHHTQIDITLYNDGSQAVTDWSLSVPVAKGTTVSQFWNCTQTIQGQTLQIRPAGYACNVAAKSKTQGIGLIITSPAAQTWSTYQLTVTCNGQQEKLSGQSSSAESSSAESSAVEKSAAGSKQMESRKTTVTQSKSGAAGPLHVTGTQLMNRQNQPVRLQGISTHGLSFYPQYVSKEAFTSLRDDWHANVVRLAMYTEENGGYCNGGDQAKLKKLIDTGVQAATELGMYVVIDWHILSDGNPQTNEDSAIAFFTEMSAKYAASPNVLYEICNEPNGTSWSGAIKPYAEKVIPAIRKNAPDAVILVGTDTWSQDVDEIAADPLPYQNIMYSFHFYAGTHKDALRQKLQKALDAGTPVFITECSICDASGNGGIDEASAEAWKKLITDDGLSYIEWNLSNKNEASAILKPDCTKLSGWSSSDLSETGKWYQNMMLQMK